MTAPDAPAPDTPPPADAGEGAVVALPTDTTPTWEIELLISGALTFASYQLPGLLDDLFVRYMPKTPVAWDEALTLTFVFAKGLSLVLALTFTLHILLRGLWAAALGLHSVYPEGVLWERVKMGPIFRRQSLRNTPTLPRFVSRLDNVASIVFALGAVLLQVTLFAGLGEVLTLVLAAVLRVTTGYDVSIVWVFVTIAALFLLPLTIASSLDQKLGATLDPARPLARFIAVMARVAGVASLTRVMGPMLLVFTSRLGEVRGVVILMLGIYGIFGLVLVQALFTLGVWSVDGYRFLATRGASVLAPVHYADQRMGTDQFETLPFIPSEVVDGAGLRLFVPYRIATFDALAERACGAAVRAAEGKDTLQAKTARDSVVACIGRELRVTLDGAPVPPTQWFAATDAPSGLRGLVTYLPIGDATEGPHVLSLLRLQRKQPPAPPAGSPAPPPERYEIPFWIDRSRNN